MSTGRPRLFFRADASPEVGLGHVRRCAVLAQACREMGAEVHLMARWRGVNRESAGDWKGVRLHELDWEASALADVEWLVGLCRNEGLLVGVIDHYRQDRAYQQVLVDAGLDWLQFANARMPGPLFGRWLHDASPGATLESYVDRDCRSDANWLLGPEYALVAGSFSTQRRAQSAPDLTQVTSVAVTFGGGDDRGAAERALDWLNRSGFVGRRVVLSGAANPRLPRLRQLAEAASEIELHEGNWDPARLMAGCQLAICSGGTTLHELACLGIPAMIVSLAENQEAPAVAWQREGMGVFLGGLGQVQDQDVIAALSACFADPARRLAMAEKAWGSQDGEGAARVATELVSAARKRNGCC